MQNPARQFGLTANPCKVEPRIYGPAVSNVLHVNFLAPRIFKWALNFVENIRNSAWNERKIQKRETK